MRSEMTAYPILKISFRSLRMRSEGLRFSMRLFTCDEANTAPVIAVKLKERVGVNEKKIQNDSD